MIADKQHGLDQIQADILQKNVCPDLAKTATQLVFGSGNADADIVFIGEAPGKKEDLKGLPFIGSSGKLLDELLASINLERTDVYITNIVKYRPPNNRDPLPAEKQEFLPFLHEQLRIINPKIVVTLGRHSTNCFFPDLQISEVHGQIQHLHKDIASWDILPLYHPAAALYNRKLRQTLTDDFNQIPTILNRIK